MNTAAAKQAIRKEYLAKRKALSPEALQRLNAALMAQCSQLAFGDPSYIHLFLPITAKNEVDTWPLADWLRAQFPRAKLVLPRSFIATGDMQHFVWDAGTQLIENALGIPEPDGGEPVQPRQLDVVFVPLLAFDEAGHRVGYGKGMYDGFLRQCRADVLSVGLSLFGPLPEPIADAWDGDVPLRAAVTPDKVYYFKDEKR
ncbi:5-formyltetrahydrofolate cyclo-ligase [Chitinophaga rhizosphaerae]|uniref:5-formyltetrahydrofolate cyclo-ligase n=1 Tax=Chitinophaga rhizosphaerae TaxID=1864947 RepID=UPI000F80F0EE|nr:5-formyltetrahydrofolate cyclo-ligase [Chitinophaga rhizosphaerae]